MSRCRRSLRATRAPCLAKSDQGERRGGGGSGTAGHPAVCRPAPHGKAHFGRAIGTRLTKRRILAVLELTKCAFPSRRDRRMRLSVRVRRRMRFFVECAFPHLGKRGAGSRKSALCPDGLTEKCTLRSSPVASYGKVHSVGLGGCRLRFSVTSPSGRRGTQPPASLRGTMENGPTGQMRSSNPPPGCGGGCAGARLHGKAQSGQRASLRARPGPGRDTIRLPVVG